LQSFESILGAFNMTHAKGYFVGALFIITIGLFVYALSLLT